MEACGLLSGRERTAVPPERDVLAFAFFCATRMEESVEGAPRDAMGRFQAADSAAARGGWLERPEVELRMRAWARSWGWEVEPREFRLVPTVDVDSALAFRGKGWLRTGAACVRELVRGHVGEAVRRAAVAAGWGEDPFDTYGELERLHAEAGLRARYFFLLADRGPHDRGMDWRRPALREVVRRVAETAEVGIHPGVRAHDAADAAVAIARERERLEAVLGVKVEHARFHYLLQRPPATWRACVEAGIRHDHSMGFADRVGFRSGCARPIRAYDLDKEAPLDLWLHPVVAMDATLRRYMGLAPGEAVERVRALAAEARAVGGEVELLWHNETSSGEAGWEGWREVYGEMMRV